MSDKVDVSRFELEVEDDSGKIVVGVTPCILFSLYLDLTDSEGILDFYQRSMEALDGLITHYQAESMKNRAKINEKSKTMLPTWIKRPNYDRNYYLQFYGASNGVTPSGIELQLSFTSPSEFTPKVQKQRLENCKSFGAGIAKYGPWTSQLRVSLPLDHKLAEPAELLQWIKGFSLVKDWAFHAGHCGYALNYDYVSLRFGYESESMKNWLASTCLRHPGFYCDPGTNLTQLWRYDPKIILLPAIERVNWLSILSEKQVDHLGGRDVLRQRFSDEPSIVVHDLRHGVIIQAGDAPQIGDVGHRDFIPIYRKVAKVIRPVRKDDYNIGLFGDDVVNEWLNAFDKETD